jgi:hypothetical protein
VLDVLDVLDVQRGCPAYHELLRVQPLRVHVRMVECNRLHATIINRVLISESVIHHATVIPPCTSMIFFTPACALKYLSFSSNSPHWQSTHKPHFYYLY